MPLPGAAPPGELPTQTLLVAFAMAATESLPGRGAHRVDVAFGFGWRVGAQREGGDLLPADHEAHRCLVGAEMGQVVLGQLGGDVALQDVASSGEQLKNTLLRALADRASRSSRGS
jgi:hypothetical protein